MQVATTAPHDPCVAPATLADWLAAELRKALAGLPTDQARYETLSRQYNAWQSRRRVFFATFGKSELPHPVYGRIAAADFVVVLADIDAAKTTLEKAVSGPLNSIPRAKE